MGLQCGGAKGETRARARQQRSATQGFVTNGRGTTNAVEVAHVAADMLRASESVRAEIPEIVRAALRADLREYQRFDVDLTASVEIDGATSSARVFDLSAGGARIAAVPHVAIGADVAVTFGGMSAIRGKVAWLAGGSFGVRFEPVMLEAGDLLKLAGLSAAA